MLKLTSPTTVAVLAALTALGPLATDMYLPAMPTMTESLNTGPDQVQLTLSLYMAGFAMAQLLCGPLSDRFGRKTIMVGGTTLFLLASLLCAFAPSIEVLLIGRFLQAFGGTGPLVGAGLLVFFGWESVFVVLALYAADHGWRAFTQSPMCRGGFFAIRLLADDHRRPSRWRGRAIA